jgi:two-component system phosphate regulon response regulator PhoB
MPNHIMIVEDDAAIRRLVTFLLQNEGFEVTASHDAREAWTSLDGQPPPDLVILDLMLPDQDGVTLGRDLRQRPGFERVPILALTARDQTVDKYEAYKAGFDGYLTKPFDPLELVYSIRAFLRLASPPDDASAPEIGPEQFRLAPAKFTVQTEAVEVTLTRLETAVLQYLMRHPREVFSADQLADTVLQSAHGQARTVDAIHAHIRNLRTKLEADPKNPAWIKTMGRRGYYFAG